MAKDALNQALEGVRKMNLIQATMSMTPLARAELVQQGGEYFRANMNPFTSQKKKDELLNKLLDKISDATFMELAPIIVNTLQFDVDRTKKYASADEQVDAYLMRRPKMKDYREVIKERMVEFRKGCRLPV